MNTGIIIQARTGSTRLPGKILKYLPYDSEITVLQQVIRRCKCVSGVSVIVATTTSIEDDIVEKIAKAEGVNVFRGSEDDVLSRYYEAAVLNKLDRVIRVTSDCPCIDPGVIENLIEEQNNIKADYVSNVLERTYPQGLDAEIFNFDVLEKAHKMATNMSEREHVTLYIYENKDLFNVVNVKAPVSCMRPDIRITLDTEEDYTLLSVLYDYLFNADKMFSTKDIVKVFDEKPYLMNINKKIVQKTVCDDLKGEIVEAIKVLDLQELNRASEILRKI
ncbi:MAG: glycosyltransferase family protein [Candidatus Aadella gelida]|nr:glycosyltransferase family protein [Candidatus Aadella gelida]